jgi:hypothetical protein
VNTNGLHRRLDKIEAERQAAALAKAATPEGWRPSLPRAKFLAEIRRLNDHLRANGVTLSRAVRWVEGQMTADASGDAAAAAVLDDVFRRHEPPGLKYFSGLGQIVVLYARLAKDRKAEEAERKELWTHANTAAWHEHKAAYLERQEARRKRDPLQYGYGGPKGEGYEALTAMLAFFGVPGEKASYDALQDPTNPNLSMPRYDLPTLK